MAPHLSLQFLGPPQILLDDVLVVPERRTVTALLAYLAVEKAQPGAREFLSSLLWPEQPQEKAFANLRHTLWEIHRSIGAEWLTAGRETICLNTGADIPLDVTRFQEKLDRARFQADPALRLPLLLETVSIYRNHFLNGFSLKEAPDFNEWVYLRSEALRELFAGALTMLVEAYLARGEAETAIPYARRLISLDPLNEASHRRMMEVYVQAGQHAAALKQFQTCQGILRRELEIDPQPETLALYKKIRKGGEKTLQVAPPARVTTPKHNFPVQLTSFIGREKERDEVCGLMKLHRLVTLSGEGGIGKTRLALQAALKLSPEYPDGTWFVALDRLANASMLPQAVASVFDIKSVPGQSITEHLAQVLQEKNTLLVLDNCEHLLDAAIPLMEVLLEKCPQVKILATSREVLDIEGEAVFQVPALSLPREHGIEKLEAFESIQLFMERAELVLHRFRLTQENGQAVAGICHRVDGIPLAIELASARVDILTPAEILEQLNQSFAFLRRRGQAAVPRHQSMRASMDWSWGLLTEQEKLLLSRLSVFAGGWTLEAARQVCADDKIVANSVLELTTSLVRQSLAVAEQVEERGTRYRLHEIVRQYAQEKPADKEKIRARHLQYFVDFAAQAESAMRGPKCAQWLETVELERGNLLAALEMAVETDVEAGLRLAGSLDRYWNMVDIRGGEYWLGKLLEKEESQQFPGARVKALCIRAGLFSSLAQEEQARADAAEALRLCQANGDRQGEAGCLLAVVGADSGQHGSPQILEKIQRALELARQVGDERQQAEALFQLGWNLEDPPRRFRLWEKAVELIRKAGDVEVLIIYLTDLAHFEFGEGNLVRAQKEFEELISLDQATKRKKPSPTMLFVRGQTAILRGNFEQGRYWFEELAAALKNSGERSVLPWVRVRAGYAALWQGELEDARAIFKQQAVEFQAQSSIVGLAFSFEGMAAIYVRTGKYEQAARLIGWADGVRKPSYPRPQVEQADVDRIISACLLKVGEEVFSDAYDEGQTMPVEKVLALISEA
jgi:predicted ATPase/DNA-binding SARP family transcriptional activator